jgi:hypothetical protein
MSGFKDISGADIDTYFQAANGTTNSISTGYFYNESNGVYSDVSKRYYPLSGPGCDGTKATNTGYTVGNTKSDLSNYFAKVGSIYPTAVLTVSRPAANQFSIAITGNCQNIDVSGCDSSTNNGNKLVPLNFSETGLPYNKKYTYSVTPYAAGVQGTIVKNDAWTLALISSASCSGTTEKSLEISYSGTYDHVTVYGNTSTASPYTVSGLNANTSYSISIVAYNGNSESIPSITVSATTLASLNIDSSSVTKNSITINWSGAFNYVYINIYKGQDNTGTSYLSNYNTNSASITSYSTSANLNSYQYYYFELTPYNSANVSSSKKTYSVITNDGDASINTLSATSTYNSITYTWNGYSPSIVYYVKLGQTTLISNTLKTFDTNIYTLTIPENSVTLDPYTSYTVYITPSNHNSQSASQVFLAYKTKDTSPSISIISADSSFSSITWTLSGSYSSIAYKVYKNSKSTGNIVQNQSKYAFVSNSLTINSLLAYSTYLIDITPYNQDNTIGTLQTSSSTRTKDTYPSITSLSGLVSSSSSITWSWGGYNSDISYNIYQVISGKNTLVQTQSKQAYPYQRVQIDSLVAYTNYFIKLVPYNRDGTTGTAVNSDTSKTLDDTATATNISAINTTLHSITVSWTGSTSTSAYYSVYYTDSSSNVVDSSNNISDTSYTNINSLHAGSQYTITVTPYNRSDISGTPISTTITTLSPVALWVTTYSINQYNTDSVYVNIAFHFDNGYFDNICLYSDQYNRFGQPLYYHTFYKSSMVFTVDKFFFNNCSWDFTIPYETNINFSLYAIDNLGNIISRTLVPLSVYISKSTATPAPTSAPTPAPTPTITGFTFTNDEGIVNTNLYHSLQFTVNGSGFDSVICIDHNNNNASQTSTDGSITVYSTSNGVSGCSFTATPYKGTVAGTSKNYP